MSTTKSVKSWGYWVQNQLVCQSGKSSGTVCGIKQSHSRNYFVDCDKGKQDSDGDCDYWMYGLIEAHRVDGGLAARVGDSGGPTPAQAEPGR